MNLMKIEKLYKNRYVLNFNNDTNKLEDFLNVVVYDNLVYYNIISSKWEIEEKNIDKFIKKHCQYNIKVVKTKPKIIKYDKSLDSIGQMMKLKPFIYQKEAIKFVLDNHNALLVLPCGAGKNLPS